MSPIAQNTSNYMHPSTVEPQHHLRDAQPNANKQFDGRQLPPPTNPTNPPPLPLTSNGYVKHEAIMRKVCKTACGEK